MNPAKSLLIGAVQVYQAVVRPISGNQCRFHPRCSDYGLEALRRHGALRGSLLTARRILRCNPWVAGGYDPVPDPADPPPRAAAGARTKTAP